jgi:hypothetical protein
MVLDTKQVRFATGLAILYIRLAAAGRLIHRRKIAFAAARALEAGLHFIILGRMVAFASRVRQSISGDRSS